MGLAENLAALAELGEVPESDLDHYEWCQRMKDLFGKVSDAIDEHRELLASEGNFHESVLRPLIEAAEKIEAVVALIEKDESAYVGLYAGVRETANATDNHMPGFTSQVAYTPDYWKETI